MDLLDLDPPLRNINAEELKRLKHMPLIPLQISGDRQYYISLRFGIFPDRLAFEKVMSGVST